MIRLDQKLIRNLRQEGSTASISIEGDPQHGDSTAEMRTK
jgi:hypothetical protein